MMMMKLFTLLATLFALVLPPTQATAREVLAFNADWRFSKSDSAMAMSSKLDDSAWRAVRLPHDWSMDEPFSAAYGSGNGFAAGGIGWYRKTFTLDPAQQGKLVTIEFDGVYDHAQVWINGHYVGGRPYGYSSFQMELSRHINFKGPNVVAVRVDHSRYADSRYFSGSGIYRQVRLAITDKLHIGQWGTFVSTPTVTPARAQVKVETSVVNAAAEARDFSLLSEVLAPDGRVLASRMTGAALKPGQSRPLTQSLTVDSPKLWDLDSPTLYTLRNRLSMAGKLVDETSTPFGIRTAVFYPDKGFFLNGKSLKLKGVCLHHDAGSLGAAVPVAVWETRLRVLRDLGVNAIRTSHNPPAPELLDLADRMGFLVQAEAFDEFTPTKNKWVQGWNVGVPGRNGYGEEFAAWSVRDMEDLVRRDRNHPSVIMWSIGNEIDYPNDPFSHPLLGPKYRPENPPASDLVKHGAPLVAAVKRFDNTRPVTAALAHAPMSDAVGFGALLDIVGYNYQELRYKADHATYPKRIIYGSENRHDYSAWAVVRDTEYISGQFLWTGIDYLGEAGEWPKRAAAFGLLDLAGFKKPRAWFRQSLWSDKPMVYIAAANQTAATHASTSGQGEALLDKQRRAELQEHWNWPMGASITVSAYANSPDVQLWLNGRLVGTQAIKDAVEGVLSWTLPYEPGVLKAVGLKDGRPVAEFTLQTAGPAARVELLPASKTLATDPDAVAQIEYRIVDAEGRRVPDGAQPVTFAIEGPAEILGIGNGDIANVDDPRDAVHAAYQGRGLAVLRSTAQPGKVTVKASAAGLAPAVLVLSGSR